MCYGEVSKHSQHRKQRSRLDPECEAELSPKAEDTSQLSSSHLNESRLPYQSTFRDSFVRTNVTAGRAGVRWPAALAARGTHCSSFLPSSWAQASVTQARDKTHFSNRTFKSPNCCLSHKYIKVKMQKLAL